MTNTAVALRTAQLRAETDKEIAALSRKIDFEKLGISKEELLEKIRHNQVEEYLKEKDVDANDRNGFMNALGNIIKSIGLGGAIGGLAAAAVNDESYHNKLAVAYEQATNLPFSEKAGNPHYWDEAGLPVSLPITDRGSKDKIPNSGIVHVKYIPTISVNDEEIESSELQNNVRLLFTKVRSANSGAINQYDQSDLFQFTLASSSVFEMFRLIVRPLNYLSAPRKNLNVFSAWDEMMLKEMTGSAANAARIIKERTEYIQAINSAIRANNAQALPIGFDLTKRRSLLNGRIFTHEGDRDEFYIFSPTCYYIYDEANGKLVSKQLDLQAVFSSPDTVKAFLTSMLKPLVNGTVTSVMAGDMKKAYEKQVNIIRELPYTLKGDVYSSDEHILEALRNADVIGGLPSYGETLDIKQGINSSLDTYIYQGMLITEGDGTKRAQLNTDGWDSGNTILPDRAYDITQPYHNIIDVKKDKPERYDIMALTRFKVSFEQRTFSISDADGMHTIAYLKQWGTEIIVDLQITYFKTAAEFAAINPSRNGWLYSNIYNVQSTALLPTYTALVARFHYLPMAIKQLFVIDDNSDYIYHMDICHGRYNDLIITDKELKNLNNASFGSLISINTTNNDSEIH